MVKSMMFFDLFPLLCWLKYFKKSENSKYFCSPALLLLKMTAFVVEIYCAGRFTIGEMTKKRISCHPYFTTVIYPVSSTFTASIATPRRV